MTVHEQSVAHLHK